MNRLSPASPHRQAPRRRGRARRPRSAPARSTSPGRPATGPARAEGPAAAAAASAMSTIARRVGWIIAAPAPGPRSAGHARPSALDLGGRRQDHPVAQAGRSSAFTSSGITIVAAVQGRPRPRRRRQHGGGARRGAALEGRVLAGRAHQVDDVVDDLGDRRTGGDLRRAPMPARSATGVTPRSAGLGMSRGRAG